MAKGDFIERLHDLVYDPEWWLEHFGTFCALEPFGTVKPEEFPPINGRMTKAPTFPGIRCEDLVVHGLNGPGARSQTWKTMPHD
ncbi:MAG TPA: hypothetical protein VGK22_14620 [Candidatus Angelobacter sp.]